MRPLARWFSSLGGLLMPQQMNYKQSGYYREVARWSGSVSPSGQSISFPTHKYLKVEVHSIQNTNQTTQQVLRMQFNGRTGASDYSRQYTRWTATGVANALNNDTNSVIVAVTQSQNSQGYCSMDINGRNNYGWNKIMWTLYSDSPDWSYGFGSMTIKTSNNLNSLNLYSEGAATYGVEVIVCGKE